MIRAFTKLKPQIWKKYRRLYSLQFREGSESVRSFQDGIFYDVAVIGGGILGTAIAREIKIKANDVRTILIEKESILGKHQSSHNSGVIHTGIYYKPGSLKAKLCVKGADMVYRYCKDNNIPHKITGKLVVATDRSHIDVLKELNKRGRENGVEDLKFLTTEEMIKIEPKSKGLQALWCPTAGNVDWMVVTESFGTDFRKKGGDILFGNEVNGIKSSGDCDYPILIKCNENLFLRTKYLVICAGLHCGTLSDLISTQSESQRLVVSFRVDYQILKNECVSTNIYGTPDLNLPFLGVHLSPMIDGNVLLGPTAVPAYKVEGYKVEEINLSYLKKVLSSPAFQNMTKRYFSKCVDQVKKQLFCADLQIKELQKLAWISETNIYPGPTAVQVQLLNEDGTFTDDFVFEFFEGDGIRKRIINCMFMPSPAASSSLAIAEYVVGELIKELKS